MTTSVACPRCQIGHLHDGAAAFIASVEGQLLSIADMPARICDICLYREFDQASLHQVELLADIWAVPSEVTRGSARPAGGDLSEITKGQRLKP